MISAGQLRDARDLLQVVIPHPARLDTKMCASGRMRTSVFKLPAGTTSSLPFIWTFGSAEPQMLQKPLLCLVPGRSNCLTLSAPATHLRVADAENRLAP